MRVFMIEEMEPEDVGRLEDWFAEQGMQGRISGLFQIPLETRDLDGEQLEHRPECGDYYLALETGKNWVRLELLVRCRNKVHCSCIKKTTARQTSFGIEFLEQALRELGISA